MQSLRLITFEDSWALELSTGPRVITKYTQIKAIKKVLLVIFTIVFYTFSKKRHTYRAIWAKALFHNDFHKNDKCKKCKGLYTFM